MGGRMLAECFNWAIIGFKVEQTYAFGIRHQNEVK